MSRGSGLIEVIVGLAIMTFVLALSVNAVGQFYAVSRKNVDRVAATYLAEEGIEAMRFLRDGSWPAFAAVPTDTPRYLDISAAGVSITTVPEVVRGFARTVIVRDAYRATATDDVVASTSSVSMAVDPGTRLVEVSVHAPATDSAVTLGAYFTNVWGE